MFLLILLVSFIGLVSWLRYIFDLDIPALKRILNEYWNAETGGRHPLSIIFGVDRHSQRHGGQLVAEVLKGHGVQELFTLCGGHISPILVAAEKLGIRVYDTRHEATAVFAADAVARLRQSIGVAVVTAGPGVTNTITAIKNAQMAESAVVIIAGAAPTLLRNRGALQDIDQSSLMRPICKSVSRVTKLREIAPTLRKAIQTAQSDTPGPVFIEMPLDVIYPYEIVRKEFGSFKSDGSFKQQIINLYLMYHISRLFGNAWAVQDLSPLPVTIPQPQQSDIEKVVNLLAKSKKPLLLIGSQAILPPVKIDRISSIVSKLGIPTYLSGMVRGCLTGHGAALQLKHNRKAALRKADLIILAGAVCDFRLSYGKLFSRHAKVISINRSRQQASKNEGVFWRCEVIVVADVATALLKIQNSFEANHIQLEIDEWLHNLRVQDYEKDQSNLQKIAGKNADGTINPLHPLYQINKTLPDDAILVADGGDFVATASYIVLPKGPLQWLDPGPFGTLGVGAGFALGAKAVFPDRPVLILYGDGACGFSLMEFDTFNRHKLSVVALIGNDACWSQIARGQVAMFDSSVALNLSPTRYDQVGMALGAEGKHIDNDDEITPSNFEKIFQLAKDGKSVVVNIVIGKSNFREESISF